METVQKKHLSAGDRLSRCHKILPDAMNTYNNSLHLTRGAGAPLAGELSRWKEVGP